MKHYFSVLFEGMGCTVKVSSHAYSTATCYVMHKLMMARIYC
jgi:hypothetical protein